MKRLVALTLAVLMLVVVFASCSATGNKIVMGTNAGFPPFEFKGEGTEVVGIDVEIAKEIAKDLGKTLEISDMEFASVVPAVQSGKIDMGIAGMTVTEERKQQVDFSIPYYEAGQVVIINKGATISAADLSGKKIGVQSGTTGDTYCVDTYGVQNVSKYPTGMEAVLALTTGKIDAVVIDVWTAKALAAKNANIEVLPEILSSESYAIAVKKGNTELLEKINATLTRLMSDGSIDKYTVQFTQTGAAE